MPGLRFPLKLPEGLSLKDALLISLYLAGAVAEELMDSAYFPRRSLSDPEFDLKQTKAWKNRPRPALKAYLRLLHSKAVTASGSREQRRCQLAQAGLDYLFAKFPKLKYQREDWDRQWRLAVYDIQETQKSLRARLRRELKNLGFIYLQKSVWVTPFPVDKELETFLKKEGLWGRILVLKAVFTATDDHKLQQFFFAGSPFDRLLAGRQPKTR